MRAIDSGKLKRPATVDPGPAAMLQWIRIDQLVVDDSYQRDLKPGNWKAIQRIADNFRWSRFSPVFVAPVEGGLFAIIDGQHRTHAAAVCGFAEVPCQVVPMSIAEQAASFAAVNGLVTKVTLFQIFKAALTAGEEWAVDCARICADADCQLMTYHGSSDAKRAGEIYAISLIRGFREKGHGRLVTFALSGLRRSEGGGRACDLEQRCPEGADRRGRRPAVAARPARGPCRFPRPLRHLRRHRPGGRFRAAEAAAGSHWRFALGYRGGGDRRGAGSRLSAAHRRAKG